MKDVDAILDKIYKEFNIEIPLLRKPICKDDALRLYNKLKVKNN